MEPIELLGHMVLYVLFIVIQVVQENIRTQEILHNPASAVEGWDAGDQRQYFSGADVCVQYLKYGFFAFLYLIPIEIIYWIALSIFGK